MNAFTSLFRNSSFSILTNILNRLGNAFIFILIVQYLGVDQGGIYTLGVSFFFIGSRFASWGLDHLLTREVSKDPDKLEEYFFNFLALRILLSSVIVVAFYIFIQFPNYGSVTRLVLSLMLLSILPENVNNLCWSTFAAREEFQFTSISVFFGSFFQIVLGYLFLKTGYGVVAMAFVFFVNNCAAMVINLWVIRIRYIHVWIRPDWRFLQKQLPYAMPFIAISIFFILDNRLDTILLSFFTSEREIGIYGAATAVILAINMIPQGYRIAILPVMARYHKNDSKAFSFLYYQSYKYLLLLGLPIAVGTFLLAEDLIRLLYGQPLPESVPILRIMSVAILFTFINVLNTRLLVVLNHQNVTARLLILSTTVNVLFNLVFMRYLGAISAGIAQTITTILLFILNSVAVRKYFVPIMAWPHLLRSSLGVLVMGFAVWQLAPYGMWVQAIVGALLYLLIIYLLGAFTTQEKYMAKQLLAKQLRKLS